MCLYVYLLYYNQKINVLFLVRISRVINRLDFKVDVFINPLFSTPINHTEQEVIVSRAQVTRMWRRLC